MWVRGWISVGDSHFVTKLMSERVLSAYYLGCPMTELFQKSFQELSQGEQLDGENDETVVTKVGLEFSFRYFYPSIYCFIFRRT